MNQWRPDVLGAGFEALDLDLDPDVEGPVVATLVRSLPEPADFWDRLRRRSRPLDGVDVLYLHGWSDYFFQREFARFWTDRGARFYALDLRKYGRSLREEQSPGYIEDLAAYDAEIDAALQHIRRGPEPADSKNDRRRLILFGHSMGGLILSLWADRHRREADALLLNSPWLDLQVGGPLRAALTTVVNLRARLNPHELALPHFDLGFYQQAQRMLAVGEDLSTVNAEWRPEHAPPIRAGWLRAVIAGHARVAAGIDVGAPVCVLLSARSRFGLTWHDEMLSTDTVIEVEGVARAALRLGTSVTVERIDGALHDVFLSASEPRAAAYRRLDAWITGWSAGQNVGTG